jgi:hypothetical protein
MLTVRCYAFERHPLGYDEYRIETRTEDDSCSFHSQHRWSDFAALHIHLAGLASSSNLPPLPRKTRLPPRVRTKEQRMAAFDLLLRHCIEGQTLQSLSPELCTFLCVVRTHTVEVSAQPDKTEVSSQPDETETLPVAVTAASGQQDWWLKACEERIRQLEGENERLEHTVLQLEGDKARLAVALDRFEADKRAKHIYDTRTRVYSAQYKFLNSSHESDAVTDAVSDGATSDANDDSISDTSSTQPPAIGRVKRALSWRIARRFTAIGAKRRSR